jgi:hypothetical protein
MGFCIGTLGHLKGKEVQIILADDNPILKWPYKFSEVKREPWFNLM